MNMWMMGYNDGGDLNFANSDYNNNNNSFNGRKFRPLIPRPLSSLSTSSSSSSNTINPPSNLIHTNDFFSQFHHMATDQSKRELNNNVPSPPVAVSSRWNPTPEQLRLLEELYRRGTRTPSADQIQHITSQLRRFGKIEGKNVFYWFQNHKARERQKRRRQMESADQSSLDIEILDRRDSGSGRTVVYEVEHTKNCSTTLLEESVPIQRAAKGSVMAAGDFRVQNGWLQFAEKMNSTNNNIAASLKLIHCSGVAADGSVGIGVGVGGGQLMMNTAPISTTPTVRTKMHQNLGFVEDNKLEELGGKGHEAAGCEESAETLQLFPLCSDIRNGEINIGEKNGSEIIVETINNLTPLQFFEFLPLKN